MAKERKKKRNRLPELLAPAGNKEAFIAAVEAGADAVYVGGEVFNARMSADNFSLDELKEATDFAHKRGVKVHVTINTLMDDDELGEELAYSGKLWEMGVDALIIQDLGFASLVKERIPGFEIHLSTQGTIYDYNGVKAASALGFSRVVLARELSLAEIADIINADEEAAKSEGRLPTEIEVFCHGALCYCYSGQCQMSRAIGGRSGNKGACAQPCRMKYESMDERGDDLDIPYPLSPSDLDLIDFIPEIINAGVASIKIEGRMKSPEYVSIVTSIYRKQLDSYGEEIISPEDRFDLAQIFNRGFTTNNFTGEEDENLMSKDSPKNRGLYVGKILSSEAVKRKKDRFYIKLKPEFELAQGDVLEIEGGSSFTITYLESCRGEVIVGDAKERPRDGDRVFRLVSSELGKRASSYFKNKDWHSGRFLRKLPLEADIVSSGEGEIKISLKELKSGIVVSSSMKSIAAKTAQDGEEISEAPDMVGQDAVTKKRIEASLSKTGGTPFSISTIRFHGDFGFSVFVSEINSLRRNLLLEMEGTLAFSRPDLDSFDLEIKKADEKEGVFLGASFDNEKAFELFFYDYSDYEEYRDSGRLNEIKKLCEEEGVRLSVLLPAAKVKVDEGPEVIPYISNVSRGREDKLVGDNIESIKSLCKNNNVPIYVGSISQIELLRDLAPEIEVRGDFGININNGSTYFLMKSMGLLDAMPSLEIDDIYFGRIPLMTIGHKTGIHSIKDRKGIIYEMIRPEYSDQIFLVRASGAYLIEDFKSIIKRIKPSKASLRFFV